MVRSLHSSPKKLLARLPTSFIAITVMLAALLISGAGASFAQGLHHPFAVGASEGAASSQGFFGFLLGIESRFYQQLTGALRASRSDGGAIATLIALSFTYGVFHAAGPGHGKAVLSAYLLANEKKLRRGLLLSTCAALLQALVAILLVTIAALLLRATAPQMTQTARLLEMASYAGMVLLGAFLLYRKGRRLFALAASEITRRKTPSGLVFSPAAPQPVAELAHRKQMRRPAFKAEFVSAEGSAARTANAASGDAAQHICDDGCGHALVLTDDRASQGIKGAALAVLAAGTRPCSGAILVLIFALAQGIFLTGVAATLAMAAGTALTTSAIAFITVYAKGTAMKLFAGRDKGEGGREDGYALLVLFLLETCAALAILLFGCLMLAGSYFGNPMKI